MAGPFKQTHSRSTENLDIFGLDDSQPIYNSGQPPPASDAQLLEQYNINDSGLDESRLSVTRDDFLESSTMRAIPNQQNDLNPYSSTQPYLSASAARRYSQSSGVSGSQIYTDYDDDLMDARSTSNLYGAAGLDNNLPTSLGPGASKARNRNSILSLGGGISGMAKNLLGVGPKYSEMDVPLTEAGTHIIDSHSDSQRSLSVYKIRDKVRFGLRRKDPDLSTSGPRIIHINNASANSAKKYVDNHISTAKYNIFTFLPKFLFEQFSKYANLFFLFTAIIQQIPNISPTNRFTTIVPLLIVLFVSAIKEQVEDYRRKSSDRSLNNSKGHVLQGSEFLDTKWVDIAVGDILKVDSEEPFPADLVILASSEPEGLCYIETANLDGETNLKIKQALPDTANIVSPHDLSKTSGRIKSEQPNSSLYTYEATLIKQSGVREKELPLQPDQLLLRGATLRNTPWVYGIVVFTGHETKLMRNATATPIKKTAVEKMINMQILILCAVLIILSIISSAGDLIVRAQADVTLQYLFYDDRNGAEQFFRDLLTYWILYSNLVPISLFVTVEIVKYSQAILISSDLDIYYDKTDTPANCRTSSLVEELGQVEYIFSDKTGTLTCNQMEFRQCSVAGIQYADEVPEDRRATSRSDTEGVHDFKTLLENKNTHKSSDIIHAFLELLSICHTVIPERNEMNPDLIKYQAASPDEGALVEGALAFGYKFVARKPKSVTVSIQGKESEYELLAVCEFNSSRKRMSAILRCPDGKIRCYCKGADTVILERLQPDSGYVDVTLKHLEEYAVEGLRTLCLAMREISEEEYAEWWKIYNKASTTVSGNRAEELEKAAELIEHDLTLLGATAIEDKLQDGVPDTIHTLQSAGIKVWVLTGDRQETAINIGMSCKLVSEDMTLLIVNEENAAATRENLTKKIDAIKSQAEGNSDLEALALVIDGKSLTYALERDLEKVFLDLAVMCKAVICW